ncbi:MAG: hypothetical protein WED00_03675 [Aquisalimonadaceae bacterium]
MTPQKGLLTFEAEGTEGGRFHSRHLHVPSGMSGLTLGRGYDFRGDYTPAARAHLQDSIVENDFDGFLERMRDRSLWPLVPRDRFQRRVRFLEKHRNALT